MGSIARHVAFALLLTGGASALAEEARPMPEAEHKTLESFADTEKTCREWTDGCAVCLRHDDGTIGCSLPGIACQPTPVACRPAVPAATVKDTPTKDTPTKDIPDKDIPDKDMPDKDMPNEVGTPKAVDAPKEPTLPTVPDVSAPKDSGVPKDKDAH